MFGAVPGSRLRGGDNLTFVRWHLAIAFALVVTACSAPPPPAPAPPISELWPTTGWPVASAESQGIDSNALADAIESIRARHLPVHSLFVERNGYAVLDAYFFPYQSDETHDLASVTKSVLSTAVGIAQREQRLGPLDQPIVVLLPNEPLASADPRRQRITLANLLGMNSGLDCRAPAGVNLLREMEESPDWVRFTWNLPQAGKPGTHFGYCAGGMHIVSAALTHATGESAFALARREVFGPLGIARAVWPADLQGNSHGFADLELYPRDAAKLGYLWLHHGRWEDRQIVPVDYLAAALSPHANVQSGIQYGYGFWLYPAHSPWDFEANGRGGQRITVIPGRNFVDVITSGGADANLIAPLLAAAIRSNTALPPDPAGDARLSAAVASAALAPNPVAAGMIPGWATAISSRTFIVSDNPLGLRTIRLSFMDPDRASVQLGFANGTISEFPVGLDGVPLLSVDAASGHRVAMLGFWRNNAFDLDYDTVARIDHYRLHIMPASNGLRIHLTERTGLVDATLDATPQ